MSYCILVNDKNYRKNNYLDALRLLKRIIKQRIETNDKIFGSYGLPLSLEAYLIYDEDIDNIYLLKENSEIIFKVFNLLNKNDIDDLNCLYNLKRIEIKNEEWHFSLDDIDNQNVIKITDGEHYLMTNMFSPLSYHGGRYFNYYLEKVVTTTNEKELGEKVRGNIILFEDN